MTDRERSDRELGFYIGLGLVLGAALGALAMAISDEGQPFWVAIGAGIGLIVATAMALGNDTDQT